MEYKRILFILDGEEDVVIGTITTDINRLDSDDDIAVIKPRLSDGSENIRVKWSDVLETSDATEFNRKT